MILITYLGPANTTVQYDTNYMRALQIPLCNMILITYLGPANTTVQYDANYENMKGGLAY
jgi:hypothetical protein